MKVCPYRYLWWCTYFWGPWVSFVLADEFSVRVTKITLRIGISWATDYFSVFGLFLTQWIMAISKGCKAENCKSHNSLKPSFANIKSFVGILLNVNLSLNQTLLTFLLYVRQTYMIQIDSGNFSVKGNLPLNWKDSTTHMYGLAVHVKEGLPFPL